MKRKLNAFEINDLRYARRGIIAAMETCERGTPDLAKRLREWAEYLTQRLVAADEENNGKTPK